MQADPDRETDSNASNIDHRKTYFQHVPRRPEKVNVPRKAPKLKKHARRARCRDTIGAADPDTI
jgi:hypothetical protein